MAWIELHQAIWTHRKAYALGDALDINEMYAVSHVIRLWTWALDNAPEGELPASPRIIARSAGWDGDAPLFVDALVRTGWVDWNGESYFIHDWAEYAGRLIDRRREDAERRRRARGQEPSIKEAVHKMSTGHPPDIPKKDAATVPNRTGPNRTVPDEEHIAASAAVPAPEAAVFAYYRERIQPQARLAGREQIRARLKTFSVDELTTAIDHFAADAWQMENNGTRGAPWFFAKDSRIEHYLSMKPRTAVTNGAVTNGTLKFGHIKGHTDIAESAP